VILGQNFSGFLTALCIEPLADFAAAVAWLAPHRMKGSNYHNWSKGQPELMGAAIRHASSFVSNLAVDRRPGSSSK
jgi:hypothetical protein